MVRSKGKFSSQLQQLYHSRQPSAQVKEHPPCSSSPICPDHSFKMGDILIGGWCLPSDWSDYWGGKWKAKMQMILNLFWWLVPPLGFSEPLISWSHFVFIQGLPRVPLTSQFSLLDFFPFLFPFHSTLSLSYLISFPSMLLSPFLLQLSFNVWTAQHRPHVNM